LSDLRSNSRDQQETRAEMNPKEKELHSLLTSYAVGESTRNGQCALYLQDKRRREPVEHQGMASQKRVETEMGKLAKNSTDLELGFTPEEDSEGGTYSPGDTMFRRKKRVGSNSKSKAQDIQEEKRAIFFDFIRNEQEKTHRKNRIVRENEKLEQQKQYSLLVEVGEKSERESLDRQLQKNLQKEVLARKKSRHDKIIARGIVKEKCALKRNRSSHNKLVNSRQQTQDVLMKEKVRNISEKPTPVKKSAVGEKELAIIQKLAAQKELKLQREAAEQEAMQAQIAATAQAAALALSRRQEEHRQSKERLQPLPTLNY